MALTSRYTVVIQVKNTADKLKSLAIAGSARFRDDSQMV